VKTNLVLAMSCFLLVLYSTFLTRSGVLGDTSVHSFVDPGMLVYWLLVGMIGVFAALGFGILISRFREFPRIPPGHGYFSREFALFLGSAALVFAAFFVTIGTSSPIITQILHGKTTAVDMSFYVTTVLPIGIAIAMLSGLGQLLWWTRSTRGEFTRSLIGPALFAVAAAMTAMVLGVRDIPVGLFILGATFSFAVNCVVGWRIVKGSPRFAGGAIAHVGLAVMFLGFVTSSKYDEKVTLSLSENTPVQALGYTLTYTGYQPVDKEKFAFQVLVERPGKAGHVISPTMYYSSYNEGLMRNPDIANFVTHDFYIAPLSLEQKAGTARNEHLRLQRGESGTVGDMAFRFAGFDVPTMTAASMKSGGGVQGSVILEVTEGAKKEFVTLSDSPVRLRGRYEVRLAVLTPDFESPQKTRVELVVDQLSKPSGSSGGKDVLVVEASVKPFINLVWAGVLVLLLGFIVTIVRRAREASLKEDPVEAI
jgi:cytochrome c-type biogenesis protein CcmF